MESGEQLSLLRQVEEIRQEPDLDLPDHNRFPYNCHQRTVRSRVFKDLLDSRQPMVISGYTSLSMVIEFLAACHQQLATNSNAFEKIQILIGNEPSPTQRNTFRMRSHNLANEVQRYWLEERGISIFLCAKVIVAIDLLRHGLVEARISDQPRPLHAKIFRGDEAITCGSSNFSYSGLELQHEANSRFQRKSEAKRYREACQLAESYWELGRDYKDDLIELLELLLSVVSWQEALGRACSELLEGDWAKRYTQGTSYSDEAALWPSQQQGIAHALWVIENVGSVLVADATGSGKTKTGAHLIRSVVQKMWSTGRIKTEIPILLCPPNVESSWQEESLRCGQNTHTCSHGLLSQTKGEKGEDVLRLIRRAQVLAVDEAHRFLNLNSNRTKQLFNNIADHVLLFTATPINRGPQDLIAIVDLLGADNFDDDLLETLSQIRRRRRSGDTLTQAEQDKIQRAIQKFTVRRTKTMLNRMIESNSEAFRDKHGKLCRYPKHITKVYECDRTYSASEKDRHLADQIRQTASQLKGLQYFRKPIEMPNIFGYGGTPEQYLETRLKSAAALAMYYVMASLRSSRVCLVELIKGTEYAKIWGEISTKVKPQETGDILSKLQQQAGDPAEQVLKVPNMPDWLVDSEQHAIATQEEIKLYEKIIQLVGQMSAGREAAKAQQLTQLLKRHSIVIAFDRNLITLADIHDRVQQLQQCEVLIATGNNKKDRDRANKACQLGSNQKGVILLCSDAMSEGINLQQASAVVNLDMPTVVRTAEQRIGRIDRMDSPHEKIEVFFPKDSKEFILSSDQQFVERMRFSSDMLGANIPLPDELLTAELKLADTFARLEQGTEDDIPADQLMDVFTPVRSLVEGEDALVSREVYEQMQESDARVIASVRAIQRKSISIVAAHRPWVFFAIAGTEWGAPRWVYLDSPTAVPMTDLEAVSSQLRTVLSEDVQNLPINQLEQAASVLETFLHQLHRTEVMLLPRRKQRALEEMKIILDDYLEKATILNDQDRADFVRQLLRLLKQDSKEPVDPSSLAERWLDLIRPTWYDCLLQQRRRHGPLRLKDIRQILIDQPFETQQLRIAFAGLDLGYLKPLDERIVAAIVGVTP